MFSIWRRPHRAPRKSLPVQRPIRPEFELFEDRLVPSGMTGLGQTATLSMLPVQLINVPPANSEILQVVIDPNPNPNPNPNQIPNPNPVTGDWFSQNLQDPTLAALARNDVNRDGGITRNDMLAIFGQVEQNGPAVSSADFSDLQTLIANAGTVNMPAYVTNLANKVVNGDTANALYQGQTLGNLSTDSSDQQLELLVDKWFLGEDHPLATDPSGNAFTYTYANGSLFNGTPQYTDIAQGEVGDCYFLAGLGTTALHTPSAIENMFIDNGDGTFTVQFYDNGTPDYVTVDRYLPTLSSGQLAFDGGFQYANDPSNILWVPLAEKAYVEENASGWTGHGTANSYQAIASGDMSVAVSQITGIAGTSQALDLNTLVSAYNAGQFVTLGSQGASDSGIDSNGVVQNHAYVLVSYDPSTQQFTLFNPWGVNGGSEGGQFAPGTITLSWAQLTQSYGWFDVNSPGAGASDTAAVGTEPHGPAAPVGRVLAHDVAPGFVVETRGNSGSVKPPTATAANPVVSITPLAAPVHAIVTAPLSSFSDEPRGWELLDAVFSLANDPHANQFGAL